MRIYKASLVGAAAGATALLLAGCGGASDGSSDDGSTPEDPQAEGGGGVASEVRSWGACDVLGDDIYDLVEHMQYDSFYEELQSSDYGQGTASDLVQCSGTAIYAGDPDSPGTSARGLVSFAVAAEDGDEAASDRFAELVSAAETLHDGEQVYEETEPAGDWDEGVFIHGDYGLGDAYTVLIRDGSFFVEVIVETGSNLSGSGSGMTNDELDAAEVKQYVLETTVPNVHSTVVEQLEAAGVNPDE